MTETALFNACRTLFGPEVSLSRDFLCYLQPNGVKVAYRTQAKINHPDRFNNSPPHVRQQQTERFRQIDDAYRLIKSFLDQRSSRPLPTGRPTGWPTPAARHAHSRPEAATRTGRPVPPIILEFGMYACYKGKVSYRDLIEALIWQRRQRPVLGEIASRWGWLNDEQIRQICQYRGRALRFGGKALEMGLLSGLQVDTLVHHQRNRQRRIGEYFIDKGLITAVEADRLARDLHAHNRQVLARRHRPRHARSY
ncbi:MAG: hypothetical protein RQ723_09095 [Desulfuromonadales bacterium]|nr:hypothetical protein [Desulfuromonadales bacterium]